jgi:hypothetical protein
MKKQIEIKEIKLDFGLMWKAANYPSDGFFLVSSHDKIDGVEPLLFFVNQVSLTALALGSFQRMSGLFTDADDKEVIQTIVHK